MSVEYDRKRDFLASLADERNYFECDEAFKNTIIELAFHHYNGGARVSNFSFLNEKPVFWPWLDKTVSILKEKWKVPSSWRNYNIGNNFEIGNTTKIEMLISNLNIVAHNHYKFLQTMYILDYAPEKIPYIHCYNNTEENEFEKYLENEKTINLKEELLKFGFSSFPPYFPCDCCSVYMNKHGRHVDRTKS